MAVDPELGRLQKANARAARAIAVRNPGDIGYAEWVAEYQKLGDQLCDLYKRRPALLGPKA